MRVLIKKSVNVIGLPTNGRPSKTSIYTIKFTYKENGRVFNKVTALKLEASYSKSKVKNLAIIAATKNLQD